MDEHGDDFEMTELDDAVIEDTVHCDLCGCSWVLGGNEDGVILEADPSNAYPYGRIGGQLKLCQSCAMLVHDAYRQNLRDAGICEHGINDGELCESCNLEYKLTRIKASIGAKECRHHINEREWCHECYLDYVRTL